jgi:hypothetical protein
MTLKSSQETSKSSQETSKSSQETSKSSQMTSKSSEETLKSSYLRWHWSHLRRRWSHIRWRRSHIRWHRSHLRWRWSHLRRRWSHMKKYQLQPPLKWAQRPKISVRIEMACARVHRYANRCVDFGHFQIILPLQPQRTESERRNKLQKGRVMFEEHHCNTLFPEPTTRWP